MREIKFRAWDKENSEMTLFTFDDVSSGQVGNNDQYISEMVVMQYTGLLDKNGKEIYEGDIIRDAFTPAGSFSEIYFDLEKAAFQQKRKNGLCGDILPAHTEIIENVG